MNVLDRRRRNLALGVLCLGELMIVLDTTIVNVALPSIQVDLGFSQASLVWVVNAYMLPYGGLLLLGGRLGDLYGQRRLFLVGIALFTIASLGCGGADSQPVLIAARGLQGVGGAVVSAIALSLIMNLFPEPGERAGAIGFYGFVCAGGGSIGVLLGGLLTNFFNWHWIFLVNVPIGVAVIVLCLILIPKGKPPSASPKLDVAGALLVTVALMLAVDAIVNGNDVGWLAGRTLGLLTLALASFSLFILVESRADSPLVPLRLFRMQSLAVANVVASLWAASMFAWFFVSALYLQLILKYNALQVGLAFLPSNLIMAAFSLGLSARFVMRWGNRVPIVAGLFLAAIGLALFSQAPVQGTFMVHVLPGMSLLGLGAGVALNPVLLAAMDDVGPAESGLASGLFNTSFMMGGALGLAILVSLSAARHSSVALAGNPDSIATNSGYHLAFGVGALCALLAAALAATFLKSGANSIKGAIESQSGRLDAVGSSRAGAGAAPTLRDRS